MRDSCRRPRGSRLHTITRLKAVHSGNAKNSERRYTGVAVVAAAVVPVGEGTPPVDPGGSSHRDGAGREQPVAPRRSATAGGGERGGMPRASVRRCRDGGPVERWPAGRQVRPKHRSALTPPDAESVAADSRTLPRRRSAKGGDHATEAACDRVPPPGVEARKRLVAAGKVTRFAQSRG